MKYIKQYRKTVLSFSVLLVLSFSTFAQWNIPDDAKNTKLPTDPTFKLVNIGKALFAKNCMYCHGHPGESNNPNMNAPDLGQHDYQSTHNAGQMYFQFNEGMGAMPSFKDQFNEDDKWCITFYVKSFDNDFNITGNKIKALNGTIEIQTDDSAHTLIAKASIIDKKGNSKPAAGAEINFYVKRIFGNLPIGDAVTTDNTGTAVLKFPDDIPGDKEGKLEVTAAFKDPDTYGTTVNSKELDWGTHLHFENSVLERSLWGSNTRVPWWLLITYLSVTGGVWLTIFYVVFQIIRLKNAGK